MSLLTDPLPDVIQIQKEEFKIETDFRVWVEFSQIVSKEYSPEEILKIVFRICPDAVKKRVSPVDLLEKIVTFFLCGEEGTIASKKSRSDEKPYYDFEQDAPLIYAAFYQQYGIDLSTVEKMHWWVFCALFTGLNDNTQFTKVVQYRQTPLSKIKDKDQRAFYRKMQRRYAIKNKNNGNSHENNLTRGFIDFFI